MNNKEVINEEENITRDKSFAEQVDEVLAGKANQFDALKVCDTPQILLDVGFEQLPMLYTQQHFRDAIKEKTPTNIHAHGLTVEQIKTVPELLEKPAIIFDSISPHSNRDSSVVLVLNAVDKDNAPLIASVLPNGKGVYNLEMVNANFITSIYGKDRAFEKYVERAITEDKVLYCDKTKSQELFMFQGLQLPEAFNNLDFDKIIHQSRNIVNKNEDKMEGVNNMSERTDAAIESANEYENSEDGKLTSKEKPTIYCEWSEHEAFENEKVYSVEEFDKLMKAADEEWIAERNREIKQYGSAEKALDAPITHQGYAKVKFTVYVPGQMPVTERQDIGDGYGGVIDFLRTIPNYSNLVAALEDSITSDNIPKEKSSAEQLDGIMEKLEQLSALPHDDYKMFSNSDNPEFQNRLYKILQDYKNMLANNPNGVITLQPVFFETPNLNEINTSPELWNYFWNYLERYGVTGDEKYPDEVNKIATEPATMELAFSIMKDIQEYLDNRLYMSSYMRNDEIINEDIGSSYKKSAQDYLDFEKAHPNHKTNMRMHTQAENVIHTVEKVFGNNDMTQIINEEENITGDKSFSEQVDEVLAGTFPFYSTLKVCDTPQILQEVGCDDLPMLYTQEHLKKAVSSYDSRKHQHGLEIEQIKKIPKLIAEPVMIFDSMSRNDSFVIVTTEMDTDLNPVIVSVKPNGEGRYELTTVEANFITSVYSKNNFRNLFENVIKEEKLLYCDKQKSQELFERWGLQLPELTNNLDFNVIIHQSRNIVKRNSKLMPEKMPDEMPEEVTNASDMQDAFRDFAEEYFNDADEIKIRFANAYSENDYEKMSEYVDEVIDYVASLDSEFITEEFMDKAKKIKNELNTVVEKEAAITQEDAYEEYLLKMTTDGGALKNVPKEFYTDELMMAAVSNWGAAIKYIPEARLTDQIIMAGIRQYRMNLKIVPENRRTEEICVEAYVSSSGRSLRYTPAVLKETVKQKGRERLAKDDEFYPDARRRLDAEELQNKGEEWLSRVEKLLREHETDADAMAEDIAFAAQFYNYSVRNIQLMLQQNRGITYVGSASHFKKMGYEVKQGEVAMMARIPFQSKYIVNENNERVYSSNYTEEIKEKIKNGSIKEYVSKTRFRFANAFYDISQTNCPPEDYPSFYHMGRPSELHQNLFDGMKEFAHNQGFTVQVMDMKSISLRGNVSPDEKIIRINDKLEPTMALSTLCHEIGHGLLHSSSRASKMTTAQKECEADVVSIMIMANLGLPISEGRKEHLLKAFTKYKEEQAAKKQPYNVTLERLIDRVQTEVFRPYVEEMNQCISRHLPMEGIKNETRAEKVIEKLADIDAAYGTDHINIFQSENDIFDSNRIEHYWEEYHRAFEETRLRNSFEPKLAILRYQGAENESPYLCEVKLLNEGLGKMFRDMPESIDPEYLGFGVHKGDILVFRENLMCPPIAYKIDGDKLVPVTETDNPGMLQTISNDEMLNKINSGFDIRHEYECLHALLREGISIEPELRDIYVNLCETFAFERLTEDNTNIQFQAHLNLITEELSNTNKELVAEYVFRTGDFKKAEEYAEKIESEPETSKKMLEEMSIIDSYKYMLWEITEYENNMHIPGSQRITTGAYNSAAIPILNGNVEALSQIVGCYTRIKQNADPNRDRYYSIRQFGEQYCIASVVLDGYMPKLEYSAPFASYEDALHFFDARKDDGCIMAGDSENLIELERKHNMVSLPYTVTMENENIFDILKNVSVLSDKYCYFDYQGETYLYTSDTSGNMYKKEMKDFGNPNVYKKVYNRLQEQGYQICADFSLFQSLAANVRISQPNYEPDKGVYIKVLSKPVNEDIPTEKHIYSVYDFKQHVDKCSFDNADFRIEYELIVADGTDKQIYIDNYSGASNKNVYEQLYEKIKDENPELSKTIAKQYYQDQIDFNTKHYYGPAKKLIEERNEEEIRNFKNNLHLLLEGDKKIASGPLIVGRTPNVLVVCGYGTGIPISPEKDIQITKRTIDKVMRKEVRDETGKRTNKSGHFLTEEQIVNAIDNLKNPIMVLRGSHDNTLIAVTEFVDNKGQEIIVPIEFNRNGAVGEINVIKSLYGREQFSDYIMETVENNNIVALNIEKADKMLLSIGVDFPKANTHISFDDTIAFTMNNVKWGSDFDSVHTSLDSAEDNILEIVEDVNDKLQKEIEKLDLAPADADVLKLNGGMINPEELKTHINKLNSQKEVKKAEKTDIKIGNT